MDDDFENTPFPTAEAVRNGEKIYQDGLVDKMVITELRFLKGAFLRIVAGEGQTPNYDFTLRKENYVDIFGNKCSDIDLINAMNRIIAELEKHGYEIERSVHPKHRILIKWK